MRFSDSNMTILSGEQAVANHQSRHQRRPELFSPVLRSKPSGPRQGESKVAHVRQGPHSALRSKNMRMLLESAKAPEDLAMLTELPVARLRNLAEGSLFSDETSYHLEQQLNLPSGWFDHQQPIIPRALRDALAGVPPPGNASSETEEESSSKDMAPLSASPAPSEVATIPVSPVHTELEQQTSAGNAPISSTQPLKEPTTMPEANSTEIRRQNLVVLLSGKGAKSAMARLLGLSPASVTGMLNGTKPLDDDLLKTVSHSLTLDEQWFDAPRTADDIPEGARTLLVPLTRGALPPPPVERRPEGAGAPNGHPLPELHVGTSSGTELTQGGGTDVAAPAGAAAGASAGASQPAPARSWPASTGPGPKVAKVLAATGGTPSAGTAGTTGNNTQGQDAANGNATAGASENTASNNTSDAGNTGATTADAATLTPDVTANSPTSAPAQASVVGGAGSSVADTSRLNPIAEALVKLLILKAESGALTEDAAFKMLGQIRQL